MHNSPEANRRNQKKRCEKNHRRIYEYLLTHPCVDCGESDPVVLEFDHVGERDENSRDVTGLSSRRWERILEEIAKCEVVCANDHARRTAKRANTLRWRLQNECACGR
jgi:hypothetical protein